MQRADKRKYHYIYKTTCVITGKYYIGMHSTDNLDDGYVGSGTRLWHSIEKHGKENHVTEIIEHLFSREDLRNREKEIVDQQLLNDFLCLNLKVGGTGGFSSEEHQRRTSTAGGKIGGKIWIDKLKSQPEKYQAWLEIKREHGRKRAKALKEWNRSGIPLTESHKQNMRSTMKERQHSVGEKNSQFGTCWIYNLSLTKCIKIKAHQLDEYISQGWVKGRKKFVVV